MNNWHTKKLGDVAKIYDGTHQTPKYVDSGIPFYSVEQVTANNFENTKYIAEDVFEKESRRVFIENGDVLMTRIGDIGTARYVDWNPRASFYVSLALIKPFDIDGRFLSYVINSYYFQKELWKRSLTVAFPYKINLGDIGKCELFLPERPEQERIVGVLEVWDEYIEKLEQKIALKEQLKKGLMQQLLTGKRRLPEFGDDWKRVRLGDIAKMQSGGTPSSKNDKFYGDDVIWVSIADMTSSGKYLSDSQRKLSKLGYDSSTARIYPANTVLYAMYASIGECVIASVPLSSSQAILGIQPSEKLDYEYLYYYLTSKKDEVKLLGQQGTQSNLNAGIVKDFKLKLPSTEEQKKIATILSKSDEETELLKKQINIIKSQKKYLLKNLITGAIRTPEDLQPLDASRLERSAL